MAIRSYFKRWFGLSVQPPALPSSDTHADPLERFRRILDHPISACMRKAVVKSEKEYPHNEAHEAIRYEDALLWFDLYAGAEGLQPATVQHNIKALLLEYWVAKINERL